MADSVARVSIAFVVTLAKVPPDSPTPRISVRLRYELFPINFRVRRSLTLV